MRRYLCSVVLAFAAIVSHSSSGWAQTAPPLGMAQRFGVLGGSAVTGATGSGVVISGDVGSSPTATVTNFPPSNVATPFVLHLTNDGVVQQARTDATAAYGLLAAQGPGTVLAADLSTVGALTSGIYSFLGGAALLPASTSLTLNGPGIFVFNVSSTLTANILSSVIGTANPCNVYWRVGSSATLNGASFMGTVIADASITIGAGANLSGRALAGTGAVTFAGSGGNTVGGCSADVVVSCPVITLAPPTAPLGTVGVAYSQQITASGGSGAYTFGLSSGTLPTGLALSSAGLISGSPTAAGVSSVGVLAADANGCPGTVNYDITAVQAVPTLPQFFVFFLAAGLGAVGYLRLRRQSVRL